MDDRGIEGTLGNALIVPGEAVFDATTALAQAVAAAVGDLGVGQALRIGGVLRRVDLVRAAAHQLERAVVEQGARQLGVAGREALVEPRIRMLNAATNARSTVRDLARMVQAAIDNDRKLPAAAVAAVAQGAIEDLQKLVRLVERGKGGE